MKRCKAKLRSSRGETLVELLASVLVAALSVGLLMAGVSVSGSVGRKIQDSDRSFYEILSRAESRQTPVETPVSSPRVEIREDGARVSIPVQVYGGQGLYSYGLAETGGETP